MNWFYFSLNSSPDSQFQSIHKITSWLLVIPSFFCQNLSPLFLPRIFFIIRSTFAAKFIIVYLKTKISYDHFQKWIERCVDKMSLNQCLFSLAPTYNGAKSFSWRNFIHQKLKSSCQGHFAFQTTICVDMRYVTVQGRGMGDKIVSVQLTCSQYTIKIQLSNFPLSIIFSLIYST